MPQLDKIRSAWVNALLDVRAVKTLVTVLVPTLVLRIFLLLVPSIMALLCARQGMASRSQVEFGVMRKYFVFSVRPATRCPAPGARRNAVPRCALHAAPAVHGRACVSCCTCAH